MTKPGFIAHTWSNQQGNSILATRVIQRIENEAMCGSGLYYEIYHYRVVSQLLYLLKDLNTTDQLTLIQEAGKRGFNLDETSVEESRRSYQEILEEICNGEY